MEEVREKNKLHTKRYWLILGVITATILVGFFIFDAMKYQSTDDAYVETTTVSVSPKVAGQIVKVLVQDNQQVKAGDVVAVIDKIDYLHSLDSLELAKRIDKLRDKPLNCFIEVNINDEDSKNGVKFD